MGHYLPGSEGLLLVCLALGFGLNIFLSGEGPDGVRKSILEAHSRKYSVCHCSCVSLPKKLSWQLSTFSKLTTQVTLEHLFLTKEWVQEAPNNRDPCVLLCHTVRHRGADLPPLAVLRRDGGGPNP